MLVYRCPGRAVQLHMTAPMEPVSTIEPPTAAPAAPVAARPACAHCGATCPDDGIAIDDARFCCHGCKAVFEILHASGLDRFYRLESTPGIRIGDAPTESGRFAALDEPAVRSRLLDFDNGRTARATFHIPAIHCVACVWLLENLFRMNPAIGSARVHFPRKELAIAFDPARLRVSDLVALLASLGYEPLLRLDAVTPRDATPRNRTLALRIGIAGFAFGNIMLLSFPSYLGLHPNDALLPVFGWLSFALALPVLLVSARDYWQAAWLGIRRGMLTIDFPLALGIAALFAQSAWDVATGAGEGYFDSFAGLVFLLLCGRWVQQRSYDALSFERDYRSYFPLSVIRVADGGDRSVPITNLQPDDIIRVRNGEVVPADSVLVSGDARIDYSFVTGESEPVAPAQGDSLYAGGRQVGASILARVTKPTSQSYLTSLWNHDSFTKPRMPRLGRFSDAVGRWFTVVVLTLATAAALAWAVTDPGRSLSVFAAVLIVACPCALALASPFAFGTAMASMGRAGLYVRNSGVIESMARVDTVVFDKTGTLTRAGGEAILDGPPLDADLWRAVQAVAAHSTHPISRAIAADRFSLPPVGGFREIPGAGVTGTVAGRRIAIGTDAWLVDHGVRGLTPGVGTTVGIDGIARGRIRVEPRYRADLASLVRALGARFRLALLTGDRDHERDRMAAWFGDAADLRFQQSPEDKRAAVAGYQAGGYGVLMLGDGLNDAGALRQSDVGIAVAEDAASFSPACDAMLAANAVGRLPRFLALSRATLRVVHASLLFSVAYNILGLSFAVRGELSPLIAAMLMPISSITVVGFAVLATRLVARRCA